VLALDVAGFVEALAEPGNKGCIGRSGVDESDNWHRRLLRARRERPRGYTAAEKCDEVPPPHGAYPKAKDQGRSIAGFGVGQWRASQFKALPLHPQGMNPNSTSTAQARSTSGCVQSFVATAQDRTLDDNWVLWLRLPGWKVSIRATPINTGIITRNTAS